MYLSLLNEKQKVLFLGLVYGLVSSDGNYTDTKKLIINSYCEEMNIKFDDKNMVRPQEEIIETINMECGVREKKIIVFESIGFVISDNNYASLEKDFIVSMIRKFNIEHDYIMKCKSVLIEYITLQNKLNKLVME